MAITAAMRQDIMELAVLMNNKAPGTKLLGELVVAANGGSTLEQIAATLAARAEFTAEYPLHQTPAEFGAEWIGNILPEADAALQAECVKIVEAHVNGGGSVPALVVSVQTFMSDSANAAGALKTHIDNFSNKVAVATYHTITKEAVDEWAIPASVSSNPITVAGGNASVDTATAPPPAPADVAKNLVMTTSAETVNGGGGDDTISAVVTGAGAAGTTLLPGDVINGGAGIDTFTISTAGAPAGAYTIAAIQANDVEKVYLNAYDTENTTDGMVVDMTLMKGVTNVGIASSAAEGDVHFNNVGNLVDLDLNNSIGDVKVTYTGATVLGATTQNIAVNNVALGDITIAGVETINISTNTLKSDLNSLVVANATLMNVTGDKDLSIDNTAMDFADTTSTVAGAIDGTIDASTFTGKLKVAVAAADNMKITGGSGNDTFVMGAGMNGFDVIDGGDGTDTITMDSGALTTNFAQTTNVETLEIANSATTAAYDVSKFGGSTVLINLNDAGDDGATVDSTVTKAEGKTIVLAKSTADAGDAADDDGAKVTITNATDTDADTATIQLNAINTGDGNTTGGYHEVDVATYETVNITANKNAAGTVTANQVQNLTATNAATVTVTGTGGFETILAGAKVTTFDASALAGALALTTGANGTKTTTYKMGGASSTLTFAGNLNNKDIVEGGAGTADTVTATVTGLTATTGALSIKDVENITLTTSGANTLAMAGSSGYKTLTVTDNKQTITGFDLTKDLALGTATDEAATASEIDVTGADATGAADDLDVKVFNNNGAVTSIVDVGAAIETVTFTTQAATNTVTLDMSTAEVANVVLAEKAATNAGTIGLGTLHKNTTSVSSTADAPVTVSFANQSNTVTSSAITFTGKGTGIQNVTGGVLNDTFTIGSTGAITHVISGGTGTDTTNITTAAAFVNAGSIDTESLNITVPAAADVDISGGATFNSGVDNVVITGGNSLSTFTTGTIHTNLKTVNMSGFSGNGVFTLAADAADSTVTLTGGPLATDTLSYNITATGTDKPKTAGIETILGNIDATSTLDMSASDAALVSLDVATGIVSTIDKAESTTTRITATAGTPTVEVKLADATGSADATTIELKGANTGAIANGLILKTDDIETVTVKSATAGFSESISLASLAMTTAGKTMAVNLTGTGGFAITALGQDVTSLDGSTKLAGGIVQTGRSSSSAADYKGGAGDDTFMMTQEADVLAGGTNTTTSASVAGDVLDIDFTAILGGISINLAADDQVVSMNGSANTAVQSGFESVDVSGFASFGASIVGSKVSNHITGTALVDSINGGLGDDVIKINTGTVANNDIMNGGGGTDTLDIGAGLTATIDADTDLVSVENINFAGAGAVVLTNQTEAFTITETLTTDSDVSVTIDAGNGVVTFTSGNAADTDILVVPASETSTHVFNGFVAGSGLDKFNVEAHKGSAYTAANAAATSNPGATDVEDDVTMLVDIAGGQDITTAAGLTVAVAAGGEYVNINSANNKKGVFVTAVDENAGTDQHVFTWTSDGSGVITPVKVGILSGAAVDINDMHKTNFNA